MKFALAVIALLAASGRLSAYQLPSVGSGKLAEELDIFLELFPVDKMVELSKVYLAREKDFQIVMSVMRSKWMKLYIDEVTVMPEFKKLMSYLHSSGLDAYTLLNDLRNAMDSKIGNVTVDSDCKITGGLNGYFKDLDELTPSRDIEQLFEYKVLTSDVFNDFANALLSVEYTNVFVSTFTSEHFRSIKRLLDYLRIDAYEFQANFGILLVVTGVMHHYV